MQSASYVFDVVYSSLKLIIEIIVSMVETLQVAGKNTSFEEKITLHHSKNWHVTKRTHYTAIYKAKYNACDRIHVHAVCILYGYITVYAEWAFKWKDKRMIENKQWWKEQTEDTEETV